MSIYLNRPALLFIGWGKLGELLGGFDLYHMRLLHALCGLLTIAAVYALMRQLLPRGWAIFATCIFGVSHSFFMISRLAMRENTAVLVEVVALRAAPLGPSQQPCARDLPGRRRRGPGLLRLPVRARNPSRSGSPFSSFWALLFTARFPVRRLLVVGSIAVAGFVLMATSDHDRRVEDPGMFRGTATPSPQHSTLMIYADAR